jgi:hypothetical protein
MLSILFLRPGCIFFFTRKVFQLFLLRFLFVYSFCRFFCVFHFFISFIDEVVNTNYSSFTSNTHAMDHVFPFQASPYAIEIFPANKVIEDGKKVTKNSSFDSLRSNGLIIRMCGRDYLVSEFYKSCFGYKCLY